MHDEPRRDARQLYEHIRMAEQAEIRYGEERLAGDLAGILTPERIIAGVSLDFDRDRDRFASALDILGLHEALKTERLHIRRLYNLHHGASHINSAAPVVSRQNLADGLMMMQTDAWSTVKEDRSLVRLITPDFVESVIILASPDRGHPGYSDLTQPLITLRARLRYELAIDSEFTGIDTPVYLINHAREDAANAGERISRFAEALRDEEARLLMPGSTYIMEIGMHDRAPGWSMTESSHSAYRYTVRSGRVSAVPDKKNE